MRALRQTLSYFARGVFYMLTGQFKKAIELSAKNPWSY